MILETKKTTFAKEAPKYSDKEILTHKASNVDRISRGEKYFLFLGLEVPGSDENRL